MDSKGFVCLLLVTPLAFGQHGHHHAHGRHQREVAEGYGDVRERRRVVPAPDLRALALATLAG